VIILRGFDFFFFSFFAHQNQIFSEYVNETFGKDAFRGESSHLILFSWINDLIDFFSGAR
jgi:hypothetical protein